MDILHFDELNSTNTFLHEKVTQGVEIADIVVVANHQTAGKGMGINRWESEARKNLLFSIALNVNFLRAEEQFKISQAVSTAIAHAISNLYHLNTTIKWPNDIYIDSQKLAGMLIQNTLSGMMMQTTIIGIGLNVNQIEFSEDIPNPISLKMASGKDYDLDLLLNELIVNIKNAVEELKTDSGYKKIDEAYRNHLFRYNEWADYEYEGEVKSMIINGYDKYGRLCLTDRSGHEIVCDIKEIKFIF